MPIGSWVDEKAERVANSISARVADELYERFGGEPTHLVPAKK